jgi:hypothetical protein
MPCWCEGGLFLCIIPSIYGPVLNWCWADRFCHHWSVHARAGCEMIDAKFLGAAENKTSIGSRPTGFISNPNRLLQQVEHLCPRRHGCNIYPKPKLTDKDYIRRSCCAAPVRAEYSAENATWAWSLNTLIAIAELVESSLEDSFLFGFCVCFFFVALYML